MNRSQHWMILDPPPFLSLFQEPADDSSQKPVLHALLGFTSCEARGDHRENQHGVEEAERNLGTRIATKSHCAGELPHIEPLPYPQISLEMARKLQSTAKSWWIFVPRIPFSSKELNLWACETWVWNWVNASIHLPFLEDHLSIRLGSLVTDRSGSLPWFLNLGMDQNWVPQELDG